MRIQSINSMNFKKQTNTYRGKQEPIQNNQIYKDEGPLLKWLLPLEMAGIAATLLIGLYLIKR